jgi:putative membrane protein
MKLLWTSRTVSVSIFLTAVAAAHDSHAQISPGNLWTAWSFEPWAFAALLAASMLYVAGLRRMTILPPGWQIVSVTAGLASLALTLLSPLHRLGGELFSAHMAQHELLMLIAAPLLVLGQPGTPMLWAFPPSWRIRFGKAAKVQMIAKSWKAVSAPMAAWVIHGLAVWLWHVPAFYQATLDSDLMHTAQHATFLGTALLFWWTLLHGRGGRMTYGAAVAYVFTTAVHTSILGALLTCSTRLWYPAYIGRTTAWGLSALQDQQLGGLIMWVPAGLVYIGLALWMFAGWLRESDQRLVYARSTELMHARIPEGGRDA